MALLTCAILTVVTISKLEPLFPSLLSKEKLIFYAVQVFECSQRYFWRVLLFISCRLAFCSRQLIKGARIYFDTDINYANPLSTVIETSQGRSIAITELTVGAFGCSVVARV